jgi:hypothetical protein
MCGLKGMETLEVSTAHSTRRPISSNGGFSLGGGGAIRPSAGAVAAETPITAILPRGSRDHVVCRRRVGLYVLTFGIFPCRERNIRDRLIYPCPAIPGALRARNQGCLAIHSRPAARRDAVRRETGRWASPRARRNRPRVIFGSPGSARGYGRRPAHIARRQRWSTDLRHRGTAAGRATIKGCAFFAAAAKSPATVSPCPDSAHRPHRHQRDFCPDREKASRSIPSLLRRRSPAVVVPGQRRLAWTWLPAPGPTISTRRPRQPGRSAAGCETQRPLRRTRQAPMSSEATRP